MQEIQTKIWEMQIANVKRLEAVDSFCEVWESLAGRERGKVVRFLKGKASPKVAQPDNQKPWTKSDMRACYGELRDISPKVANAWRRWASEILKLEFSRLDVGLQFRILLDSLECHMYVKYSSSDWLWEQ
jgi:hypothetical protein